MTTTSAAVLYICGAVLELAGIVLAASPDLVPQGRKLSRWLGAIAQPIVSRVLRLIGRPRAYTVQVGPAEIIVAADSVSIIKSAAADATLEQKVDFL